MGKLKTRLLQAKYYILASVCASAVFGGLIKKGTIVDSGEKNVIVRCALGDGGDNNEAQKAVAQAMRDHGCEEIMHLGDNVYETSIKGPNDPKFQTNFWDTYKDFKVNIITNGNHDSMQGEKGLEAWIALSGKYKNLVYPSHFFLYKSGDWCIFSWFSEAVDRDDDNEFIEAQNFFAENLDLSGCGTTVSMTHFPYTSQGKHGDSGKNVKAFYEKHILGKFDYALSAHDHNLSNEPSVNGTKLFVSGGASRLRDCKKNEGKTCWSKFGFLKFVGDKPEWVMLNENTNN